MFASLFHLHLPCRAISDRSTLSGRKKVPGVLLGAGAIVATFGCVDCRGIIACECRFPSGILPSCAGASPGVDVEVAAGAMTISTAPFATEGVVFGSIEVAAAILQLTTGQRYGIG